MTVIRDEMLEAWQEWDLAPGNKSRTDRLVDAETDYARQLGTTQAHVRDLLAALRRCEFTHNEALDVAEHAYGLVT